MSSPEEGEIPAVAELRSGLVEAARHQTVAPPARSRMARGVLILAFAILLCAAAAGAATLLPGAR